MATVTLTVNGVKRAVVPVGRKLRFSGSVEVPPKTGTLVSGAWDFEGQGTFAVPATLQSGQTHLAIQTTHSFSKPGTYFVTLRVETQREGNAKDTLTKVANIDRVRVIVK